MIRTVTVVPVFLLVMCSATQADDSLRSFLDPETRLSSMEIQHRKFYRIDMNISPREYEEIYSHNRRLAQKNLGSYSKDVLELTGAPAQGLYLMGAAISLMIDDEPRLALNKSKTLALEFKDVNKSERTLFFRVNLNW